jgi:chitinase
VAAAVPLIAGGVMLVTATNALAAPAIPTHFAAPYLQISPSDASDMAADMSATGLKDYTLAFLIPKSGCTPEWEDDGNTVGAFNSQISSLQAAGGNVIVSFGGAEGGELAQTCTSVSSLTAAYASVVNTTGVTRLDFDIEGGTLSDTSATSLRDQALAALQAENPAVQVDFTLAVNPTGLPTGSGSEYALLQDAKSKGVKVSTVNIMTMDFGDGQNALNDAESAAQATDGQLESLYGISASAAYGMMGLTPIAGKNDDNENFTTANASTLESFAASKGVGELSFWEVDEYDKATGYQYSSIFNKITGSSGGGGTTPPPSGSGTIAGVSSGLCLSVTGASKSAGATADIYTCNGSVSENWTVNSNGTITGSNSGLCLSVSGNSSALKSTADINTCDGDSYEKWTAESNGTIVNGDGQCLSVTGSSTANYATADLYTCNGSASENWTVS